MSESQMPNLLIKKLSERQLVDAFSLVEDVLGQNWRGWSLEAVGAFCGFRLVGALLFRRLFEEIEIFSVAVSGSFRRRGIASKMLEFLISNVAVASIVLEVAENNHAAISLYKKFGFEVIGKRKNYYEESDALIMILNLNKEVKMEERLKELAREKFHHFKRLEERHQELDDIIDKMEKKAVLTPEEEIELKKLKAERLRLRDEMLSLMNKVRGELKNEE